MTLQDLLNTLYATAIILLAASQIILTGRYEHWHWTLRGHIKELRKRVEQK